MVPSFQLGRPEPATDLAADLATDLAATVRLYLDWQYGSGYRVLLHKCIGLGDCMWTGQGRVNTGWMSINDYGDFGGKFTGGNVRSRLVVYGTGGSANLTFTQAWKARPGDVPVG
jgi:hypothetical protein